MITTVAGAEVWLAADTEVAPVVVVVEIDELEGLVVVELLLDEELDEEELATVLEDAPPAGKNTAAIAGFDDKNPAVTSPLGQPLVHGLDLQQPMKGGLVYSQVYH